MTLTVYSMHYHLLVLTALNTYQNFFYKLFNFNIFFINYYTSKLHDLIMLHNLKLLILVI